MTLDEARRLLADAGQSHVLAFWDRLDEAGRTRLAGQVAAIDWKKWDEKGIAVLRLADGRTVKLDSWHYAGMPEVVETLTAHREDLKRG